MKTQVKWQWIAAILFLVCGTVCLFLPAKAGWILLKTLAAVVTLSALALWYVWFKHRTGRNLMEALVCSVMALLMWNATFRLVVLIFTIYMLALALLLAVQVVLDFKEKASPWEDLFRVLCYLALGTLAFWYHGSDEQVLMMLVGLYLLLQGVQLLLETVSFSHHGRGSAFLLKRWVSLPVFVVSFLPSLFLRSMLKGQDAKKPLEYDKKKNDEPVNVRVFIHTGLSGEHMVGHMTFAYKDTMYSFGNYDTANEKFFRSLGPGILFTVDADQYVNNSCIYEGSVLYEYGLHITPEQEKQLEARLKELEPYMYEWQSPLQVAGDVDKNFEKYEKDYASRLWYRTRCKFHKFKEGPWKTYWILGDNCSLFAEDMLSSAGLDVIHKSGVVSPGEYWEFFETEFNDPDSNVVSRKWHNAKYPETLEPVKPLEN